MISIAHQESKLNPQAKSGTGAIGVMQLLCGNTSPAMDMCTRPRLYSQSFERLKDNPDIIRSIQSSQAREIIADMAVGKFQKYPPALQRAGGNILNATLKDNQDPNLNIIIGCAYIQGIGKMVEQKSESEDTKKMQTFSTPEITRTTQVVEYYIKNGIPEQQRKNIESNKISSTLRSIIEAIAEYTAENPKDEAIMKEFLSLCRYNGQKNIDTITINKKSITSPLPHRAIYALTIMTKNRLNLFQE